MRAKRVSIHRLFVTFSVRHTAGCESDVPHSAIRLVNSGICISPKQHIPTRQKRRLLGRITGSLTSKLSVHACHEKGTAPICI
jgi:hypothetical protein